MITSYSQTCLCGRSFDNAGAFTRHKKTCSRAKKRLANTLSHAKESYRTKKCRIEGNKETAGSPQTETSMVVSHTGPEVLGDTSGASHSVHSLMDTLQPTHPQGPGEVSTSGVDEVWLSTLFFRFI